ncbi:uncharacterized protein BYT42DRAFT_566426 [Radiomyces spectabilis]|uniref:uncharacterized protein n=1 Tax=Radiomyces spectabilis TaxID=64574 RepID=UPI00221F0657|nr:uncharacterized protein BYT42DRAFT_566426 [Radiomyces spectabilis]KAI8381411.1 hypothetical protein BYT42DRAFT_566426 [Radiomyces spectabilis]
MMRIDTSTGTAQTDFRTAVIQNHWNDPPKNIFQKTSEDQSADINIEEIQKNIQHQVTICTNTFTSGANKRIADDTSRRMNSLLNDLGQNVLTEVVIQSLSQLCLALQEMNWTRAQEIHRQLMTTEYEKHGIWLLGLKRLIDLSEKASASS